MSDEQSNRIREAADEARAFMATSYDHREITAVAMERIASALLDAIQERDDLRAASDRLKATLADVGWTSSVGAPPDLACEALRTLQAALERRQAEGSEARRSHAYLRAALTEALAMLEHRVIWSGTPADAQRDRIDRERITELRAKFLGGGET